MISKVSRKAIRDKNHLRNRKKVLGTTERPRLAVFRSLNHYYLQVINDDDGKTLASASTLSKDFGLKSSKESPKVLASELGKLIAKKCISQNINTVVFDRCGFAYKGNIKVLADSAREAGLKF